MIDISQVELVQPSQLRAARVLLRWSVSDAVAAVGISPATLHRVETQNAHKISDAVMKAILYTYEKHGIDFTFEGGIGVQLRSATDS